MASASDGTKPLLPMETIYKVACWMMVGGAISIMMNANAIVTVATGELGATALILGIILVFYADDYYSNTPPQTPVTANLPCKE